MRAQSRTAARQFSLIVCKNRRYKWSRRIDISHGQWVRFVSLAAADPDNGYGVIDENTCTLSANSDAVWHEPALTTADGDCGCSHYRSAHAFAIGFSEWNRVNRNLSPQSASIIVLRSGSRTSANSHVNPMWTKTEANCHSRSFSGACIIIISFYCNVMSRKSYLLFIIYCLLFIIYYLFHAWWFSRQYMLALKKLSAAIS